MKRKIKFITLAKKIANLSLDKKAENVVVLDISKIASFCDFFVIMTGKVATHVETLVEYITEKIEEHYGIKPVNIEGLENKKWVILDYAHVIVHIMTPETREFYMLERIWHKGKKVKYEKKSKSNSR